MNIFLRSLLLASALLLSDLCANQDRPPVRSLNQLDSTLSVTQMAMPSESADPKSIESLPDAANFFFRVCVDQNGKAYEIEPLDYPDQTFMEHWKDFLTNTRFYKPKMMKEEVCVETRFAFKLRSKSPESWELLIWDPKEMDSAPNVVITDKAISLGQKEVRQSVFFMGYVKEQSADNISNFFFMTPYGASIYHQNNKHLRFIDNPVAKGIPINFSEDIYCIPSSENAWRLSLIRVAKKSSSFDLKVSKLVKPEYPFQYRKNSIEGSAKLRLYIDTEGNVISSIVDRATTPLFGKVSQEAVDNWKFESTTGEKIRDITVINQNFGYSINGGGQSPYVFSKPSKEYLKRFPNFNEPPDFLNLVEPVYPYEHIIKKKKGKASVTILVDSVGVPHLSRVNEATDNEFAMATIAAVQHFRFKPAAMDGKAVPFAMNWSFEFDPANLVSRERKMLDKLRKQKLEIVPMSQLEVKPQLLNGIDVQIPSIMDTDIPSGTARVRFYIDEKGTVLFPEILECSHPAVGYAAAQALLAWDFAPGKKDGKPVVTMAIQPFTITK